MKKKNKIIKKNLNLVKIVLIKGVIKKIVIAKKVKIVKITMKKKEEIEELHESFEENKSVNSNDYKFKRRIR